MTREYQLGNILGSDIASVDVDSGTSVELAENANRVGLLIACTAFSTAEDFVVVKAGAATIFTLSKANPMVYMSLKYFGSVIMTGEINVEQGSGDVTVVTTELTVGGAEGLGMLYLPENCPLPRP